MRGLRRIINHFRHIKSNGMLVGGLFAIAMLGFGGFGLLSQAHASADPDNDIVQGGIYNRDLAAKCTGDVKTIMDHYWIDCNLSGTVDGRACRDGNVYVGDNIVARNSTSIGRLPINGSHPISIGGQTYYETTNSDAFLQDCIDAFVLVDGNGTFKYAILKPCGNPIYSPSPVVNNPPSSPPPAAAGYTCDYLTLSRISDKNYSLTAAAHAWNGATITGYRFNFGDGTPSQQTSGTVTQHIYSNVGTFVVSVTVEVSINGQTNEITSPACGKQVVVQQQGNVSCDSLQASMSDRTNVAVTINKTNVNATYQGATVDYGDGTTNNITGTTDTHTYAKEGSYTIKATLTFNLNGSTQSATCQASITVGPETCAINPNVSKNSPDCTPCQYNANIPANSANCTAPTPELPQTGPGSGSLVGAGLGLGSLIVAASAYIGSRRDLLASVLGR